MPKPKLLLFFSHFETEQANLLPQGQEQKCSFKLKEGNSACFFSFYALLRKLKGKKKKVHFRLTANKTVL